MDELNIPEHLAREHSGAVAGKSAAQSARDIGARWAETFETFGGLTADQRVLDIGCGPGRMAIAIGERFGWRNTLLGFDIAAADIAFCDAEITAHHESFRFAHLDVRNHYYNRAGRIDPLAVRFPAADGAIDFAFATSVFTHMFDREVERYLSETFRCLAPGGAFLATFFILDDAARAALRAGKGRFQFRWPRDLHTRFQHLRQPGKAVAYDVKWVRQAYARAGFVDWTHDVGGWWGEKGCHSQDMIVARKPA